MKCCKSWALRAIVVTSFIGAVPAICATTNDAMSNLPPQRSQGDVTWMSGGVGHDEAAAMRREERAFPLSLEFVKRAKPTDDYVTGVEVTIAGPSGKTELQTVAGGPILLARLPDGKYKIHADLNGQTKTRDIVIAQQKAQRIVFEW